jgi:hypothetical protein
MPYYYAICESFVPLVDDFPVAFPPRVVSKLYASLFKQTFPLDFVNPEPGQVELLGNP